MTGLSGYSDEQEITLEVTKILPFKDFGEAWKELGTKLVPYGAASADDVKEFYSEWYSDEVITKNGVIAIGVIVV